MRFHKHIFWGAVNDVFTTDSMGVKNNHDLVVRLKLLYADRKNQQHQIIFNINHVRFKSEISYLLKWKTKKKEKAPRHKE